MEDARFKNFTQAAHADKRKLRKNMLRFRSVSPGYWTALLLPLALYFSTLHYMDNSSFIILSIITFNSCLLSVLHMSGQNLPHLLQRMTKFNIALSILSILYCLNFGGMPFFRHNSILKLVDYFIIN